MYETSNNEQRQFYETNHKKYFMGQPTVYFLHTHKCTIYTSSYIRRHAIFSHPYNQQRKWCVWNEKYCILSLTRVRPKHIVFHQTTCSNLNGMHTIYMYVLVTCQDYFLTCNPMFLSCCLYCAQLFLLENYQKYLKSVLTTKWSIRFCEISWYLEC